MTQNKKLALYIMYGEPGCHPFISGRRTEKNAHGRYVTREQFMGLGVLWPTSIAKTRTELETLIGRHILDEIFPPVATQPSFLDQVRINPDRSLAEQLFVTPLHTSCDQDEDDDGPGADEDDLRSESGHGLPCEEFAKSTMRELLRTATIVGGSVLLKVDEEMTYLCRTFDEVVVAVNDVGESAWNGEVPWDGGPLFPYSCSAEEMLDAEFPHIAKAFELVTP